MLPIEIQYSPYAFNNLPRTKNIPPNNLFYSTEVPQHRLQIIHVRRCPVYVLNPSLQAGGKIPRWEPCSKREVFCDHSKVHSSDVPQVLNQTTGSITTQFYFVFDDLFFSVHSIMRKDIPPAYWDGLCLEKN